MPYLFLLILQLPKFAEEKGQIYYPNPPKMVAPNSTFKELEHNLSPRTTNMLRNTERAQGITTYSRNFTGKQLFFFSFTWNSNERPQDVTL